MLRHTRASAGDHVPSGVDLRSHNVHIQGEQTMAAPADDEDEFFDARSHGTMSRQSSLGSSLPSPTQSQLTSASERGSFLNTYRAEFGVDQMSAPPSEEPMHDEAAQPSKATVPGDAMRPPKHEEPVHTLSDDPSMDPLDCGSMLDISRLDQPASDGAAGTDAGMPSSADPLSSPLLQVSPDPSLDAEHAVADPFAQASPEPVLLGEGSDTWTSAAPPLSTALSPLDAPAAPVQKVQTTDDHDSSGEPEDDGGINVGLLGVGQHGSSSQAVSETLDDVQADQSGGLFGGLEMEDVDQPQEPVAGSGSTASDKGGRSVGAGTARVTDSSGGGQEATTSLSQDGRHQGECTGDSDGDVQPTTAKEDVVQPLPISKPASAGRDIGNLSATEGAIDSATRPGSEGTNGATTASTSNGATSRPATVAGPSAPITAASSDGAEARDPGAALQEFTAMLSRKKRHYFMTAAEHRRLTFGACRGEIPHTFTAGELTVCVRARRVRPDPYASPQRPGQHPRHPYALAPAAHRTLGNVAVLTASATRSDLPPAVLHVQLELLHLQLLAWTSAKYERVLMDNPALDTSAALAGTEASFEALVKRMDFAMDYVLQAVETLRMRPIVRGAAEAALQQAVVDSDGVCGVVACGHQVVAVASHPQLPPAQHLHAWDLLLLLNLVTANSSYQGQLAGQQAWVPLCLPKSAPDCFHFVYVHYPSSSSPLFIAIVGRSQQKFFETHSVREPLMATLESTGVLEEAKVASGAPSGHRVPPAAIPFQERLRHLQPQLYHMTVAKRNMFVQTAYAPVIGSHRLQKQAQQDCMRLHASMWGAAAVSKTHDPMPIQWRTCSRWALIGVIERGEYEAYAVMDPLIHKTEAMALFNHALAYLLENPENWQASTDAKVGDGSGFWNTAASEGSWSRAVLRS